MVVVGQVVFQKGFNWLLEIGDAENEMKLPHAYGLGDIHRDGKSNDIITCVFR